MPTTQIIYGLECTLPDQPSISKIDGNKLAVKKQKFRRVELPKSFDDVEFDADKNPIFTEEQVKFIDRELDRCIDGYWFMNKGVPTWITGFNYYYLNYWTLENGIHPEYRQSSRKFFLFFEECYNDPYILFLIRGKKRREGATSEGTAIETCIATFGENRRCGNISKTGTDVIDLFQNMIVYGYEALPIFLKPRTDGSTNAKKKLSFVEQAKRGKDAKNVKVSGKREGLNSFIDYRNTALNSYDSGRWDMILVDESGKWEEVDVNKYLMIVMNVLKEGGKRGFSYWPTTVNPPKNGGANFKKIWDKANHFKFGRTGTSQRAVRFFQDGAEGLDGFIDEYGESVIDPPNKETLDFLIGKQSLRIPKERISPTDLSKGSAKYLDDQLSMFTDEEDKAEFKRMYPRTEGDMFEFGDDGKNDFNKDNLKAQIKWLEDNPTPLRRGDLNPDFKMKQISFCDNSKGKWLIYKFPKSENAYSLTESSYGKVAMPNHSHIMRGGVDTFRNDRTNEIGSKGVIWFGSMFDNSDDESGELHALYVGRPRETDGFWREMLMGAMWYGAKIVVEKDATQEYKKYFSNRMTNMLDANCNAFLSRTPDAAIDPNRKTRNNNRFDFGVASSDPFAFSKEIELAQSYIQNHCWKIKFPSLLMELIDFDVADRTKYDQSIGFMMWLLGITGETKARKAEAKKQPLIQTYRVGY